MASRISACCMGAQYHLECLLFLKRFTMVIRRHLHAHGLSKRELAIIFEMLFPYRYRHAWQQVTLCDKLGNQ